MAAELYERQQMDRLWSQLHNTDRDNVNYVSTLVDIELDLNNQSYY